MVVRDRNGTFQDSNTTSEPIKHISSSGPSGTVSTVTIAGISSKLALQITEELLKQSNVHIRGSCRDVGKLPQWLKDSPRVRLVGTSPYEAETLRGLIRGSGVVLCCYLADNETMLEGQKLLIDLCEEEDVPRYIASDYTADYTKLEYGDVVIKNPMKRVKAYVEGNERVKGVHVLVGLLMETYWDLFGLWDLENEGLSYWGNGSEKWGFTTYRTAAQFVAAVALDPDAVGTFKCRSLLKKTFQPDREPPISADGLEVLGDLRSTIDIANDVNSIYGLRPNLKCLGSLEDLRQQMGSGDQQNALAAGQYHMLSGKWPVSDKVDNGRYPEVRPA